MDEKECELSHNLQTTRFTIDLPLGLHTQLKYLSVSKRKSMRDMVIEAIYSVIKQEMKKNE